MDEDMRYQAVIDKYEIIEVATISRWCRDSGDSAGMMECFHPDAQVETSWFIGSREEWARQSNEMMAGHNPKDVQRHIMGNPRVTLKGDHAVCEYTIILYQRRMLDGYEFDLTTWCVSLDFFEKRDGLWRISRRATIYEKDRMDPYNPAEVPDSYFAQLDLSGYPPALRYHCYRNERSSGRPPSPNLVLKGTPKEEAIRKDAKEWLAHR
jgi:hypothetical protein